VPGEQRINAARHGAVLSARHRDLRQDPPAPARRAGWLPLIDPAHSGTASAARDCLARRVVRLERVLPVPAGCSVGR
jgi:hypothetical protein